MVEHAFHAKTADKNTAKYAVYKRKKHFFTMFCKKSQNIHYYKVIMQVLQGIALHKGVLVIAPSGAKNNTWLAR